MKHIEELDSLFKDGYKSYKEGNYGVAYKLFNRSVKKKGEHYLKSYYIGKILYSRGKLSDSLTFFTEVINKKQDCIEVLITTATINQKLGKHEKSVQIYNEVLSKNLTLDERTEVIHSKVRVIEILKRQKFDIDFNDIFEEGMLKYLRGDHVAAIKNFSSYIEKNPKDHLVYLYLSIAYCNIKNIEKGTEIIDKFIEFEPNYAKGWYIKAKILQIKKDFELAIDCCKKALDLDPESIRYKSTLTSLNTKRKVAIMLSQTEIKKEVSGLKAHKIGDLLGEYKILKIFGGGMGRVYICVDEENITFALKTFREELFSSDDIKKSFIKEVVAWIDLGYHPNIVFCFEPYSYMNQIFVVLEYVKPHVNWGNTLTNYLPDLIVEVSIEFAIQFCHGMEYAFSHGISCHRDIKPDNIMISDKAIVKITDFGLVKMFDKVKDDKQYKKFRSKTNQNLGFLDVAEDKTVVGTPPWMAPEQFEGRADIRSDIYSFGVVLYQMVNRGKLPFLAQSVKGFYIAHKTSKIPNSEPKLNHVIKKCLQKDPNKRYQSFKDLRQELESIYNREFGEWNYTPKLKHNPNLIVIQHLNKGKIFIGFGMFDDAIIELEKALEFDTIPLVSKSIYFHLGSVHSHKRQFSKSIDFFNKALEIDPDYEFAICQLGNAIRDMGDLERAIPKYKRAISINPKFFMAHVELASAFSDKGLFQEALHETIEALKIDPNYTQLYYNLGNYYLLLGQVDKARESYHKFVTNPPSGEQECVDSAVRKLKSSENKENAEELVKDFQRKWNKGKNN